jgi:hypothetical protein
MKKLNFLKISKIENNSQTAFLCKKNERSMKMHDACWVIGTGCKVHALSLTMHAKYDTTCTIDEPFEWPKGAF